MSLQRHLQKVYPHVPVWAQNAGISLYGLSYRSERLGGLFETYVRGFRERDRISPDLFRAYLTDRLRAILRHAALHAPYYGPVWAAAGIDSQTLERITLDDLHRLPSTPKEALRADPDQFVVSPAERRGRLHRNQSSGSTGTPVTCIWSADDRRRFTAGRDVRSFGWAGVSVRSSRSMIGGRLVVPRAAADPPFHRYNWVEKQLYFSAFHISPANAPSYVAALNSHQPVVLTGYASSYSLLAGLMLDQGLTLTYRPRAIVLTSERLTAGMRACIEQAFGARAYEEYGAVENCGLATECEHGSLHVNPDFGIVEIVDDDGRPVGPGQEGRILCTGLLNWTQPLVRYEIGDSGVWSGEPCRCGRDHLPVLREIVGRLEDLVVGPDGRRMVRFHWVFLDLPHVIEGQIVQETPERFRVRVVATDWFNAADEETIRRRFFDRLGPVRVDIERVPAIERTARGKFKAVVSQVVS